MHQNGKNFNPNKISQSAKASVCQLSFHMLDNQLGMNSTANNWIFIVFGTFKRLWNVKNELWILPDAIWIIINIVNITLLQ